MHSEFIHISHYNVLYWQFLHVRTAAGVTSFTCLSVVPATYVCLYVRKLLSSSPSTNSTRYKGYNPF